MVDVHHVRPRLLNLCDRTVGVEEAGRELRLGVDRVERRQQEPEVEPEGVARHQRARATEAAQRILGIVLVKLGTAPARTRVLPAPRHHQRLELIEVGVERAVVLLVEEGELGPGVHVADPDRVLVVMQVPAPVERRGGESTLAAEPHPVFRDVGAVGDHERDVVHRRGVARGDRHVVFEGAVELEVTLDLRGDGAGGVGRGPDRDPRLGVRHRRCTGGPFERCPVVADHFEPDRRLEQRPRRRRESGHPRREAAGELGGESSGCQVDRAAEDLEVRAGHGHR